MFAKFGRVFVLSSHNIDSALLQRIEHCSTRKSTCRLPIYIYIYFFFFFFFFKSYYTNSRYQPLTTPFRVESEKWEVETDTKQTNTHTHTNANRNCNAFLTGWEKQLGLNTSSETIFEQWKDKKSSQKKGQANNILTEKK